MPNQTVFLPTARAVHANLTAQELKSLASQMPNARKTKYENLNVQTQVLARSKASTFLVLDDPENTSQQAISREEGDRIAKLQDEYIAKSEMIIVDGYIGNDPEFRVPARLYIEAANANIAGMQKQLYFEASEDSSDFEPELMVIYTPNFAVEGYPNDRVITVNLESGITRVCNSDYFGESKKGGLRMWNKLVYDRGGLPLHAGCKVFPENGGKVGLIVGLSGTGKTTTTFTRQNGSLPVQDDFVAMMPGGKIYATEAGCFAKTYGLNPDDEPTIYNAVIRPEAYLENVSQNDAGEVDFFDENYTSNGRATFSFSTIEAGDARDLKSADFLLILNRNENIIPAVAKLNAAQAAAYFMLGETQGTSAGGAEEAGKFLRVPGTNPFFPMDHDHQGNRFLELMGDHQLDVYLLNTGRVGGADSVEGSEKVRIPHSSAIVKAIAEGTIQWQVDPDFGYQVASEIPGIDACDHGILRPRELYERLGRVGEYDGIVDRLKAERKAFLEQFPALSAEIIAAVS